MIVAREVLPPVFLGTHYYVCATTALFLLRKRTARLRLVVASVTPGHNVVLVDVEGDKAQRLPSGLIHSPFFHPRQGACVVSGHRGTSTGHGRSHTDASSTDKPSSQLRKSGRATKQRSGLSCPMQWVGRPCATRPARRSRPSTRSRVPRTLPRRKNILTTIDVKMGHLACYRLSCVTGAVLDGIRASTGPVTQQAAR